MVEGVHADGTVALGLGVGVPALPDGGCTLVDAVEPGGITSLEQQRVGIVDEAVLGQRLIEDSRAEESRVELEAVALDGTVQIGTGAGNGCLVGQHVVAERHEVAALSALRGNLGGAEEALLPLGLDVTAEFFVLLGLLAVDVAFLLGEGTAGAGHEVGSVGVVADADVASVGRDVGHPVAVDGVGAVVLIAAAGLCREELHVALVGLEIVAQDVLVACHHIDVPGHDDAGFRPPRRGIFNAPMVGRDDGVGTVGALGVAQVAHPLLVEVAGVAVVEARQREDLCVGSPAHALVALRTVGGHADEVGALSPHDVAVELVHIFVAGAQRGLFIDGTGHGLADDVRQFHVCRGGHLDVSEAEVGCRGVEALALCSALQGIVERCLGGTEVLGVDGPRRAVVAATAVARRVRHLAEAETQFRPALALGGEAHPARGILSEVDNGCLTGLQAEAVLVGIFLHHIYRAESLAVAFRAFIDLDGLGVAAQSFDGHDCRALEGANLALEVLRHGCAEPVAVVVVGCELTCLEAGIVGLAVVDVAFAQRSVGVAAPG